MWCYRFGYANASLANLVINSTENKNYKFLCFAIGVCRAENDTAVVAECELGRALQAKKLDFSENMTMGGS